MNERRIHRIEFGDEAVEFPTEGPAILIESGADIRLTLPETSTALVMRALYRREAVMLDGIAYYPLLFSESGKTKKTTFVLQTHQTPPFRFYRPLSPIERGKILPFEPRKNFGLLEPFGSLYGFLEDLHEQVSGHLAVTRNESAKVVLQHVLRSIEAAGVVVREMGG